MYSAETILKNLWKAGLKTVNCLLRHGIHLTSFSHAHFASDNREKYIVLVNNAADAFYMSTFVLD